MQLIGVIVGVGSSSLSKAVWMRYAADEPELCSYESIEVRNPATGQKVCVMAPESSKRLFHNEKQIGAFAWSENDEPLLWVESEADWTNETIEYAEKIALKLRGKFTTDFP